VDEVSLVTASFDKVVAFYKATYKEGKSMEPPPQGQVKGSRMAVFIPLGADAMTALSHYLEVKEFGSSTCLYDTKAVH
jgi:hypothetical protein